MHLVVIVQAVGTEQADDGLVLHLGLGDIRQIDTCRVALELHVEPELVFLDRRRQIVDVLHHQVPVALRGVVAGVLE